MMPRCSWTTCSDLEVIPTRGALPTLVLTAGQGRYTAAQLVQYGALVMLPDDAALLLDNLFRSGGDPDPGGPADSGADRGARQVYRSSARPVRRARDAAG